MEMDIKTRILYNYLHILVGYITKKKKISEENIIAKIKEYFEKIDHKWQIEIMTQDKKLNKFFKRYKELQSYSDLHHGLLTLEDFFTKKYY